MIVKDHNGHILPDLTERDFNITEDGISQSISVFQFQALDDDSSPNASKHGPRLNGAADNIAGPPPRLSEGAPYRDRRLLVFFFDFMSMSPADQVRAIAAADKFVRTRLKPQDLLEIISLDSNGVIKVHCDLTDEQTRLLKAIQQLPRDSDSLVSDPQAAFGMETGDFTMFAMDRRLSALRAAIKPLAVIDGQKSFVYFSAGLPFTGSLNQAALSATINAAIRANVAVFPVDARGLTASAPLGDASNKSPGGAGAYSGANTMAAITRFQVSQDGLFSLAADTGGRAMLSSNDLVTGIVEAQLAISSYYIVGYYPSNPAQDGKFRRVNVFIKGMPDAKLAYRKGYFAPKTFDRFTTFDNERHLEEALSLNDPITEIAIALEVDYFCRGPGDYLVPVTVKLPGADILRAQHQRRGETAIDLIGLIEDDQGAPAASIRDKIEPRIERQQDAAASRRPILYERVFKLPPGNYKIRVLARDGETGRIGTYQTDFVIPNLMADERQIPISSVVLSAQSVKSTTSPGGAGSKRVFEQQTNNLKLPALDGQHMVPSVTRVFSKRHEMEVYVEAYTFDGSDTHPIVAFIDLYRAQTRIFRSSPVEFAGASAQVTPMIFRLGMAGVEAGDYMLQVSILDPRLDRVAFWQAPIVIVP